MPELDVLYEDNHLLAVNKPAGMLVQGDETGDQSLLEYGKAYLKEKYAKPGNVYLGLVHRLDRPASGVVLLARTDKAASRLSEQFRAKTTEKVYRIVVHGAPAPKSGRLRHVLVPGDGEDNTTRVARPGQKGQDAALTYEVLAVRGNLSDVRVTLETGRKHQIRAQFAAIGHPVYGDLRYGSRDKLFGGKAIALHAESLSVKHPTRDETVKISAPLPSYWPAH